MTTYRVDLPWPAPLLSLNRQLHWAEARRVKEQLRSDVLTMARVARLPKGLGRVHVELHWAPSTKRRRDTDNPTPTLKVGIDSLVKYGLIKDDSAEYVSSECVIDPVRPDRGGLINDGVRVYLLITDRSDEPKEGSAA